MHPTSSRLVVGDNVSGEISSLFSFLSQESSTSGQKKQNRRRRFSRPAPPTAVAPPRRFPGRLLLNSLQRLTGKSERSRAVAAPSRTNIMHYRYPTGSQSQTSVSHSQSLEDASSAPLTDSLISEVIRDRKQFDFIVEGNETQWEASSAPEANSLCTANQLDIRGLLQSYLSALEMAELESRAARGCNFRPKLFRVSGWNRFGLDLGDRSSFSRLSSFRDTSRRMRPVAALVGVYHVNLSCGPEETDRIGLAHLPEQMHRKAVKKGFNFTLMVVGESGLGKSTLINSLFMQELYGDRKFVSASDRITRTTQIKKRQIELDERGVKLRLTIIDTPGFNDALDATNCWRPIRDYINSNNEQFFKDECGLNRKNITDNRIHCCLYFISPYGHGLRQVDVEVMRQLQDLVNIIPVIAKADTFTAAELVAFKARIISDFERHKIGIYRLPECDSDEDDEIKKLDKEIKAVLPFAVIGSNCTVEVEANRKVRGRKYPWGVVDVDNGQHCDFTCLRTCLLKTHMQDLKDVTLDIHYENYRAKYITERMSKRQTDRRDVPALGSAGRPDRDAFETIVDQDTILRPKEDEMQTMEQVANLSKPDPMGSQQLCSNHSSATVSISSLTPSMTTMVNNA